jgi:hypothetical protein
MLARWHSPRYGLIAPDVFIPVAEEIGLIAPLSECLIRQALIDAREWDPSLTLSVNISPMQVRDPGLPSACSNCWWNEFPGPPAGRGNHRNLPARKPAAGPLAGRQPQEPGHPHEPR